jgi:Lipopolysaccharide-assembly
MVSWNLNTLLPQLASLMVLTLVCCCPGCGYMLGSPQVGNVRTVHVPVFQSESFRRNMDYLLTEAVQREVKTRTAYRLADEQSADSVLTGRIIEMRKMPLSETRYDDSRELQLLLGVEITWVDRRTGHLLQQHTFPLGNTLTHQASQVSFAPEVGHSMATAQQDAAQLLAARIVDLMEAPW